MWTKLLYRIGTDEGKVLDITDMHLVSLVLTLNLVVSLRAKDRLEKERHEV